MHLDAFVAGARPPRDRDDAASCPAAPPASRCGSSAGRCRARSAARSPSPAAASSPSSRGSRRQGGRGRRCPSPRPAPRRGSPIHSRPRSSNVSLDQGIEHQVHDVVGERAADQKLDRDIVDPLRILARVGLVGAQPAVREDVADRAGGGLETLPRVGQLRLDDVVELQVPFIERVRRSGEAHRAEAVLLQKLVRRVNLARLVDSLRCFPSLRPRFWLVVSSPFVV